jgi:hypothetical protein
MQRVRSTERVLSVLPFALPPPPPWLVLAGLLGLINAAACFMLIGRHLSRLTWYALLGMLAAALGQVVGEATRAPAPVTIGDVNLLTVSLAAWIAVGSARLVRL